MGSVCMSSLPPLLSPLAPFPPIYCPTVRPSGDRSSSPLHRLSDARSRAEEACVVTERRVSERDDYLSGHKDSPSESRSGEEGRKSAAKAERESHPGESLDDVMKFPLRI